MNIGHFSLPGNGLPDTLVKVGTTLDHSIIPLSLLFRISSQRLSLYTDWKCGIQSGFFQHQIPVVCSEELTLHRSTRWPSLVYAATGTALFLLHTSTGLVEPKLLRAVTVVTNHKTFFISC